MNSLDKSAETRITTELSERLRQYSDAAPGGAN
jgi:hypothetical protein